MRPWETFSPTVPLSNEQRIEVPVAVVERAGVCRGEFLIDPHTHARLRHYVKRLVQEPAEHVR